MKIIILILAIIAFVAVRQCQLVIYQYNRNRDQQEAEIMTKSAAHSKKINPRAAACALLRLAIRDRLIERLADGIFTSENLRVPT